MSYTEKAEAIAAETKSALQTLYDALPPGQQKTVQKDSTVKALLERYGIK